MSKWLRICCLCLTLSTAAAVWGDDGQWQKISVPYLIGQIDEISIGHLTGGQRYIFAADSSANGTLYMTSNDGLVWEVVHEEDGFFHRRVVVQETDFLYGWTLMIAGGDDPQGLAGPYRTVNSGGNWGLKANGLTTRSLFAMAAVQSSTYLKTAFVGGRGTAGNNYQKLFETVNGGDTWILSQNGIPSDEFGTVYDISIYQVDPDYMYCSYEGPPGSSTSGIYRSLDGGANWSQVIEFDPEYTHAVPQAVAIDPYDAERAYVVERSPYAGRIFKIVNARSSPSTYYMGNYGPSNCIRFDDLHNAYFAHQTLHVGGHFDYWATRYNDTDGWTFLLNYTSSFIGDKIGHSLAIDPSDNHVVCIGGQFMFYFSNDQCATFEERVYGARPVGMQVLGVNGTNICAAGEMFLFKIPDFSNANSRWTLRHIHGLWPAAIEKDWNDPNDSWFLSVNEGGVLDFGGMDRSMDDGASWFPLPNWVGGPAPRVDCLTPDTTYESDSLYFAGQTTVPGTSRFWSSWNDGIEWYPWEVDATTDVRSISIHPDDPENIIVAEYGGGAYRSSNWGHNWEAINTGLTNQLGLRIKYCPDMPNVALLGTEAGVFKTQNVTSQTPTWSSANNGCLEDQVQDIEFHPTDNSVVCLSVWDGETGKVYISADTARSWVEMAVGLGGLLPYDISTDPNNPNTFYVASEDGIYKLDNPVKSGTLASTQTWGPGTVIINGDVTVPSGVTLNIQAGTNVLFVYNFDKLRAGANASKSEIIVYGTLNASGSQGSPVVFKSSHPTAPAAGQWYGIRGATGNNMNLNYCEVKHAYIAVTGDASSSFNVNNSLIEDNSFAGISLEGGDELCNVNTSTLQDCGQ